MNIGKIISTENFAGKELVEIKLSNDVTDRDFSIADKLLISGEYHVVKGWNFWSDKTKIDFVLDKVLPNEMLYCEVELEAA